MERAADLAVDAIMYNMGQVCCAGSRTYVHEDIYDAFVTRCVATASARVVGDPMDSGVVNGPQVRVAEDRGGGI